MTDARILGVTELAQRWGVTRGRIYQILAEDERMPRGQTLTRGQAWTVEQIEAYEAVSGRSPVTPEP